MICRIEEREAGGAAEGVLDAGEDVGLAGGDDGLGGEGEGGRVVGEVMRRQECPASEDDSLCLSPVFLLMVHPPLPP
jgi:hypothetical protein